MMMMMPFLGRNIRRQATVASSSSAVVPAFLSARAGNNSNENDTSRGLRWVHQQSLLSNNAHHQSMPLAALPNAKTSFLLHKPQLLGVLLLTNNNTANFHDSVKFFSTTTPTPISKPEYIHPLSQIVLEHLQSRHSSWVQKVGLDEGLKLNKDGTFVLRFPGGGAADENDVEGRGVGEGEGNIGEGDGRESSNGSIWTMFEPEEKKHYLCITKGNLVGRYLLQDNKKPAWHSDKRSTPERVQDAVDEMICKIDEAEA